MACIVGCNLSCAGAITVVCVVGASVSVGLGTDGVAFGSVPAVLSGATVVGVGSLAVDCSEGLIVGSGRGIGCSESPLLGNLVGAGSRWLRFISRKSSKLALLLLSV